MPQGGQNQGGEKRKAEAPLEGDFPDFDSGLDGDGDVKINEIQVLIDEWIEEVKEVGIEGDT